MKPRRRWQLTLLAVVVLICAAALFITGDSKPLIFDLRDGTRLEIVRISVSTNHTVHFGSASQKLLFKIFGPRLSPKWVGYLMTTPAQVRLDGNLGIFVRHHFGREDESALSSVHNLKIKPVTPPRKEHLMFLSFSQGEFGLWELNYWNETHPDFLVENSKGDLVGRFSILRDSRGGYTVQRGAHK